MTALLAFRVAGYAVPYLCYCLEEIEGMIEREQPIEIAIPPLRSDKAFIEIPHFRPGLVNRLDGPHTTSQISKWLL